MRGFSTFSIVLLYIATILIDGYILATIMKYSSAKRRKVWTILYEVFSVMGIALVTQICCWRGGSEGSSLNALMWMLYIYFSIYVPKFIYLLISVASHLCGRFFCRKRNKIGYYGSVAGAAVAILMCAGMWIGVLYTRKAIEVNEVEIASPKLPAAFDGYRIVQFSDAHVGTWGNDTTFISELVNEINGLKPDLVLFTVDIVNRNTEELLPFVEVLGRIKAKDGVISVLGNHDYGDYMTWDNDEAHKENNRLLHTWEKAMGWDLLNNDYRYIVNGPDSIAVIGVENWGEPPFHQYGRLKESYLPTGDAATDLNNDRFKILLSHNPEHWNREVTNISNIDLTLAGHTHAMQSEIRLFGCKWSPAVFRYPYWGGLYTRQNHTGTVSNLYVNIGCGEVGIPARFGAAYPELTLITLRSEK
ncbi:MAG: metallophosphoesterase [Muribaculaceae bacterium]|nr:metallophosphoesterase [Muribaculaceae bacterium]